MVGFREQLQKSVGCGHIGHDSCGVRTGERMVGRDPRGGPETYQWDEKANSRAYRLICKQVRIPCGLFSIYFHLLFIYYALSQYKDIK